MFTGVRDGANPRYRREAEELGEGLARAGGTLDELFEAWTWQQLGVHTKPVALLDAEFWKPLVQLIDHMSSEGFVRTEDRATLVVATDADGVLSQLRRWTPPPPKWG